MWKASMYIIDKSFSFCYGHRVWSQQLEEEFCEVGDTSCKCRHLHGHEGKLHVYLESNSLTRGMVTDFKHLGWLKDFLDNVIDHKFILDVNDPWFENITNGKLVDKISDTDLVPAFQINDHVKKERRTLDNRIKRIDVVVPETDHVAGQVFDVSTLSGPEEEFYEGFFLVDFVPTSENLCRWIHGCIKAKMDRLGIRCEKVEWSETPKSRATFIYKG